MFNDMLMSSLVHFNAKTYSCLFHPQNNIPVFAYLQMDMIINYFHDIGFFLQLCSNEEKVCRSTCSASESGRKHQ